MGFDHSESSGLRMGRPKGGPEPHALRDEWFAPRRNRHASEHGSGATLFASSTGLNRRARHSPIRTKYATISLFGLEQGVALLALIEPLTGVGGHRFCFDVPAFRAGQCRLNDDCTH